MIAEKQALIAVWANFIVNLSVGSNDSKGVTN